MKIYFVFAMAFAIGCWAVPKPMESIENYNVMIVHGAYSKGKGFLDEKDTNEAYYAGTSLENGATLGAYDNSDRITNWVSTKVLEEPGWVDIVGYARNSYVYNWRSFSNPANTSLNNAHEMGDRTWSLKGTKFEHRRALMEEAQELKAVITDTLNPSENKYGQVALEIIRKNPDLYRQLPSRYILIGHSMGGVVSREYVQGNFYNGDVDKIITLDSPHEGTGALNMLVSKKLDDGFWEHTKDNIVSSISGAVASTIPMLLGSEIAVGSALTTIATSTIVQELGDFIVTGMTLADLAPNYYKSDPLVHYVDPNQSGFQTIDSLNNLAYVVDSLPMFRILASQHGMTYTDPEKVDDGLLHSFVIDNYKFPLLNYAAQVGGTGSVSARYVNARSSYVMGFAGISMQTTGSSIVPAMSSEGKSVDVLNDNAVDVRRAYFNAAPNATGVLGDLVTPFENSLNAILSVDNILGYFVPQSMVSAVKISMGFVAGCLYGPLLLTSFSIGVSDIATSHQLPIDKEFKRWMLNDSVHVYEDFLYERPFVNLALNDVRTLHTLDSLSRTDSTAFKKSTLNRNCFYIGSKDNVKCAMGLFKSANDLNSTHENLAIESLKQLRFKSGSDWTNVGVKVDRWEKVDGLTPGGELAPKSVPIRHVERYKVPDITVYDWINKYSFIIDDLMPHRLRQIRMNFNYQEEIAWECDITKDSDANDACTVYMRSGGGSWKNIVDSVYVPDSKGKDSLCLKVRTVPHPVKKNGLFDFIATDFYPNLLAIQKDNQNTVTISTVNKIGLSNTQRFYYLFKATANKLDPVWPQRDVVLNKIKGFKSYATALGYQGFKVMGAKDRIVYESGNGNVLDSLREMVMAYDTIFDVSRDSANRLQDLSSAYFTSKWEDVHPAEGNYHWMFVADIRNMASASDSKDSSNTYNVPFRVDTTAPVFNILAEGENINPDSLSFVARFAWADAENSPDIRAMRISLEKANGNSANLNFVHVADFPALYDVCTPEFAIGWNDSIRESVRGDDGFYRIKVLAMDNAVPSAESYGKVNRLVSAISGNPGNVADSLWPKASDSLNVSVAYDTFFVDTKAPELVNPLLTSVSTVKSRYDSLARPARNSSYRYVTYDSLLTISYSMHEPLNGRDSSLVSVAWLFIHADDTTKVDHAGDSVYVKDGNAVVGSWTEMSAMRLEDGDYNVRAVVRDFAKNSSLYSFAQKLRVDKTAPHIESLVSTQLVYPDSIKDYSAKIAVNEKYDIGTNRTGVYCYYRVSGCGKKVTSSWKLVSNKVLKNDTVLFKLDSLEGLHGKCYLEAACVDAAGNVSVKTDLFYMGERTPVISSPRDSAVYSSLIAITGFAPPSNLADSLNTVYRLRYARVDSLGQRGEWDTSNVFVVSALRSNDRGYISKVSQSNDAVLGYLDRKMNGVNLEGTYVIELGTCAGTNCVDGPDSLWKTDTTLIFLGESRDSLFDDNFKWHLVKSRDTLRIGYDTLELSLYPSGHFNGSYFLRLYAEDKKHVGLFDESVSKVWRNPYYGMPNDTASDSAAVWFYEQDGKYHLQWKGLAIGDTLKVSYDSAGFGDVCNYGGCINQSVAFSLDMSSLAINSYLEDIPEWIPPSKINHEMLLSGGSGHVVMTATEAFRVSHSGYYGDTTFSKMKVYFGSNAKDGFYWIADGRFSSDTLNPIVMGWTVNPQAYGLKFAWTGVMETGNYPAAGEMKIYAEITENVSSSPHVFIDTETVVIEPDTLRIALADSLPDFMLLKNDSTKVCKADSTEKDSCENRVLWLRTMVAKYGIKNKDAKVGIYVTNGVKTIVLQNDTTTIRANSNDTAYQISWNGKDSLGHADMEIGDHELLIVAKSIDGNETDTAKAVFKVKHAETMFDRTPDNPKYLHNTIPSIYVSEAIHDAAFSDVYRYEPIADYLIKANVGGWKLPDFLREGEISLTGQIAGTQEIIGYEPKRFSLAIKRHRKELRLVAISYLHYNSMKVDCGNWRPFTKCQMEDRNHYGQLFVEELYFDLNKRSDTLHIFKKANDYYEEYGYDWERMHGNYFDVTVFSYSGWGKYMKEHNKYNLDYSGLDYDDIRNSQYAVWNLKKISGIDSITLPNPYPGNDCGRHFPFGVENASLGCQSDSTLDSVCIYNSSTKTSAYDVNANLFEVEVTPGENEKYYTGYGIINPTAKDEAYTTIKFDVVFKIPKSYWEADFGMDNLVNRTVRFDHTNMTIFGNDVSGYWAALDSLSKRGDKDYIAVGSYHDGNEWKFDKTYGLLTPFETQRLHYFPATELQGGLNTFLFADEDSSHVQAARFDLRFYGPKNKDDFFEAKTLGVPDLNESIDQCNPDPTTNILAVMGAPGFCEISYSELSDSVKSTPFFAANSSVEFFVGRNTRLSSVKHRDTIAYPAVKSLKDIVADTALFHRDSVCKDSAQGWDFINTGSSPCYKYYDYGSRIHYYYGDYTDSTWSSFVTHGGSVIKNMVNSPAFVWNYPQNVLFQNTFKVSEIGKNDTAFKVKLSPDNYDKGNHRYYVQLDSIIKVNSNLVGGGVSAKVDSLEIKSPESLVRDSVLRLSAHGDSLYVYAESLVVDTVYRMSKDSLAKRPVRPQSDTLSRDQIYRGDDMWVRDVVVNRAKLMQLDSSEHSHLTLEGRFSDSADMLIKFKPANLITVKRPKELVEVRAYLNSGVKYQLAYLNQDAFYAFPKSMLDSRWRDSLVADSSGWYRLGWFDVNRLQGNTQFMLLWGDDNGTMHNFSKFDMVIGRSVTSSKGNTVKSLFEEVCVTFPENSVTETKDVTVRTIDAKDYPFDVFNDLALKGPIVEVLPSMPFENKNALPRVQMKISREEMAAMRATPQTVRLYKIDTISKKFVPLQNALYGFLNADGSAVMDGKDTVKCNENNKYTDARCIGNDSLWAYLLISAETQTFSVFTAMDSSIAETPSFTVTILPEIATTVDRAVRVDGIARFKLYVDDDSLWGNRGDSTPPIALSFAADSNGFAQIVLPSHGNAIDTNYVFVVALSEPDSNGVVYELPAAPAVARALTVNAQFACSVPSDSLWLGLDNGYMAYGASCNHPGYGLVSLYRDGRIAAEIRGGIPDTIIYDGYRTAGTSRIGKIAAGIYESRYIGVSVLGMDMQMAGPKVYTDSARPVIRNFSVQESSEVLDRIFTISADVYDSESGIARVVVTPVFGGDTLRNVSVVSDSAGHVVAKVRLTRKQLAVCTGCYIAMDMHVEDYGHNYAEQGYASEKLYPYPAELALWYPARESGGKVVHEVLGTGHDLFLTNMKSPWLSDAGLYFGKTTDYTIGEGLVDFESSPSYSFEARIKVGYAAGIDWRRILGFNGVSGQKISLEIHCSSLRLVEGTHVWRTGSVLPSEKTWFHVVVTVDSAYVKFYVDGELVAARASGISQERELEGVFSMGKIADKQSYIGNIADIRMYSRALTAAEVEELSKPVTDAGEVSDVIVVAVKDMDIVSGFTNDFSCSVAGNKYLTSGDSAVVTMPVFVQDAAEYNVILYVRAAASRNVTVSVGESSLQGGTAAVSNVWRAVTVSGVTLDLSAGTHMLTLKVPEGLQIGGLALTTANIPASMIAWGVSTSDKVAGVAQVDTVRKVKSYLRYEGYPETSTLRPRIRLQNVSGQQIEGFSVRYYFRGEDAQQASVERYWPIDVATFPAVHSESANTGYVEWKFTETQIPVNGTVFSGDGPHFGLYNADYIPWDASDDPSFVDPALNTDVDGFYEDMGIVILDNDNNLIGGSCAEMEDPVSLEYKARVLAADVRGDNQASEIHFKVENTGNVALKNFDVRYYFYVEEGFAPVLDINHLSDCSSATMENLGTGRWQVTVHCDSSLAAGKMWREPVKVSLHLPGWVELWNVNDDPSHDSLGVMMHETRSICIFDSTGNMLYGDAPVWALPAPDEMSPDSVYNIDFGYHAPDNSVPVVRTPEGIVLTLDSWTYVELSLVTALGKPIKTIFNGTLAPGEQLVRVDWTGVDMSKTYLMLKVNGSIKSTKKLSLL